MSRDAASDQAQSWKRDHPKPERYTTSHSAPVEDGLNALTVGSRGPQLLQDHVYLDLMSAFDRERIPERVVHAKGSAAMGYFEVTHDISKYTKACVFKEIGKRTKVALRFSTVGGEKGSPDTARDPRGFAMKFYTEDGNWDLVGNNTPIFFIRDPMLFPSFIHTQKRNPQTNLKDPDMFWDFISLRPETSHQVSFLFGDRGIPDGYRHMNGYGSHTFKLVNDKNEPIYCKFHLKTNQGIKNILAKDADVLNGTEPDYSQKDLFNAIAEGNFPSWSFKIQVMTYDQAKKHRFNPFDVTKVWPQAEFPLIPVGQLVLNKNPDNYFAEVEQLAFCPAHMIPGIEPSPDKMLQGRLFSYSDTHRHRLGVNYQHIPVNSPLTPQRNYQRDGPGCYHDNQGSAPNYFPNSFNGPQPDVSARPNIDVVTGDITRHDSSSHDNFSQVGDFWRKVLDEGARRRLVENMAGHLSGAQAFLQKRMVDNYGQCDKNWGEQLQDELDKIRKAKDAKL